MENFVPRKMFFVKGVGTHKDKLASFEGALKCAGIEKYNLVYVSGIFPQNCKIIPSASGLKLLRPGQIVFCVMSKNETNEPNRLASASIGLAVPNDDIMHYGYLAEHHTFGEIARISGEYAEYLAATMLATTLGMPFDPDSAWDERKKHYSASDKFVSRNICQSAEGNKKGLWTTVISAAMFIL